MAATPLSATSRYIPPGVRQYYWVTTISNKNAPTRSELNAGTDLTAEIAEVSGFNVTSEAVDTPDLATRFTSKIPGMITADDSSITLYADETSDDVRLVIERDDAGYVVVLLEGDVAGQKMDVFPVKVTAVGKDQSVSESAKITVQFVVTSIPAENVTIPA